MPKPVDINALSALVTPVVAGLGYELVDIEWKHEAGHWILRVFIDHPVGYVAANPAEPGSQAALIQSQVSLADCSRVSHSLGAELDVAEAIHVPFNLEVSSPGLNRPLTREADFCRFAGHKAKVRTRTPIHDPVSSTARRNFAGRLLGAQAGRLSIDVDGQRFEIPVAEVEKAHLVYEF